MGAKSGDTQRRQELEALMPRLIGSLLEIARYQQLISTEHFSAERVLLDVRASHKRYRLCDADNDTPHGRSATLMASVANDICATSTDTNAELLRKAEGMDARLRYSVHHVTDNHIHEV
jgi:hypothetical protein